MRSEISPDDLHVLIHEADRAARRFLWKSALPRADLDDIRQELLVDLITRLPGFDRERGSIGAFANIVLGHRTAELAQKVKRERALFGLSPVSLDEPLPGGGGQTLGETIADDHGLAALHGQVADRFDTVEQQIDMQRSVLALDPSAQNLCAGLRHNTVNDLADLKVGARSSLYRRVKDIRLALTAFGIQPA
jgi:RNA polymerase sigma-70 factor (ECF subfamily)